MPAKGSHKKTRVAGATQVSHATDVRDEHSVNSILPTPSTDCQAEFVAGDRSALTTEAIAAECFQQLQHFCGLLGELLSRLSVPNDGVFTFPEKLVAIELLRPICEHRPKPEKTRGGKSKRVCGCFQTIKSALSVLVKFEAQHGRAFPTMPRLAESEKVARTTIEHWLRVATAAGYLTVHPRTGQTNRYEIDWGRIMRETRDEFTKRLIPAEAPR